MAYPQQGPGPSTYYQHQQSPSPSQSQPQPPQQQPPQPQPQHQHQQQPPPPLPQHHHVYGTHSPGPRPNYYQYPPPGPPPLPLHQYAPQPSPSSRGNHRGGSSSYGARGGAHGYHHQQHQQHHPQHPQQQHIQHPQQQQHYQHHHHQQAPYSPHAHAQHIAHLPQHPHPQHQHPQHMPSYSPQPAKYTNVHAPTFYPSPSAPVFTPSWQTQQAMMSSPSPLPKQLSMPQPQPQPPPQTTSYANYYEQLQPQLQMPSPSLAPPVVQNVVQGVEAQSQSQSPILVPMPVPVPVVCEELKNERSVPIPMPVPAPAPVPAPVSVPMPLPLPALSLAVPSTSTSTATSSPSLSPSAPSFFPSALSTNLVVASESLDIEQTSTTPTPQQPAPIPASVSVPTSSSYAQMGSIATHVVAPAYPPSSTTTTTIQSSLSSSRSSPVPLFSALPNGFPSTSTSMDTATFTNIPIPIPIPASSSSSSSASASFPAFTSSSSLPTSTATSSTSSTTSTATSALPDIPFPPHLPGQPNPTAQWAIWSRRPHDPAHAPGIIISPRARPPRDVVAAALDLRTPAGTPPADGMGVGGGRDKEKEKEVAVEEKEVSPSPSASFSFSTTSASTSNSSAVSVADADAETTVPCSPASSHTSVDGVVGVEKERGGEKVGGQDKEKASEQEREKEKEAGKEKEIKDKEKEKPKSKKAKKAAAAAATSVNANGHVTTSAATTTEKEREQPKEGDMLVSSLLHPHGTTTAAPTPAIATTTTTTPTPATPITTPAPGTPAQSELAQLPPATTASAPAPAPASAAAPVKRSWASLLRPASPAASGSGAGSTSTSTSGAQPSAPRNALPVSSVVGFSIPAAAALAAGAGSSAGAGAGAGAGAAMGLSGSRRSELIALLTSGPPHAAPPPTSGAINFAAAAASANTAAALSKQVEAAMGATLKIRPRGLVNSGNMCFANSVLQVMVYCPPFHRLFGELGRVFRGLDGERAGGGREKEKGRETPLVDATIEFLREFVDDKDKNVKGVNGVGNGNTLASAFAVASGSGKVGGKGKEKDNGDGEGERDEDDWDGESFLPTGIYDAMKAKKRFDNMRGGHQEDAEEFFGFYLDTLEEELLALLHTVNPPVPSSRQVNGVGAGAGAGVEEKEEAAPPEEDGWLEVGKRNRMVHTRTIKATESPITRIFGGKFRSTLRAPGQKDSVVVEDWRSLRLDIQRDQIHTIQDALSYISHPQPVQVTQTQGQGQGTRTIEAQQQVLIEALPPILVLHIKRFCYDTAVGGVVKVGKQVGFGPELEIGSDVMVPAAKKAQPVRYKLFSGTFSLIDFRVAFFSPITVTALYHHGLSASGGHYTLDVLHPNRYPTSTSTPNANAKPNHREGWVRIDDNLVSDVRPDDVFGAYERDESRSTLTSTAPSSVPLNALPVSSVVGFSIPAAALAAGLNVGAGAGAGAGAAMGLSGSRRSELVALLTTGPPHAAPPPTSGAINFAAAALSKQFEAAMGATLKIRPRGLVNSGNICFANSVLQVMVYCPPFHRLFGELGRVFRGVDGERGSKEREKGRETPLVDATIEFLWEFVDDKDKNVKGVNDVGNGNTLSSAFAVASGSGKVGGKGKERDNGDGEGERDEDDWDGESFLPTGIYDAMKAKKRFDNMRGGHQEDAEEFFGFYLDTLEEELLALLHTVNPPAPSSRQVNGVGAGAGVEEKEEAAPPEEDGWLEVGKRNRMVHTRTIKATESPITRIFGGKFRSTLRAPGQKDSVVVEDWRSLRLDIQRDQIHTIQDALSYILHPQPVQVTQTQRQDTRTIEALPPILVLHIKRFCYDTAVGGVVKVGKQVGFGPELEIGSDVMVLAAKRAQPVRYKLFSGTFSLIDFRVAFFSSITITALYYRGLSASGGHYTLDLLHPNRYPTSTSNANAKTKPNHREGWVRIDDNLVSGRAAGRCVRAQQQVLIEALPLILVLHIKRFCYDAAVGGVVKVGKQVGFRPELEIGSGEYFFMLWFPLRRQLSLCDINCLVCCATTDSPHQAGTIPLTANANAKPNHREGWVRINDNLVSDVRLDDVFGTYERDESRSELVHWG
ncbi:hypothetical protein CVT25_000689 [Psilocybe cyanescens]|uniref:ubiquitinyl hydrolase 1 n=1 Tax=Psilocybe cyanescens TaxID=93625 RepID=A0A409WZM1_PSICY|nr:hypothetical protein CVT25_000689 [Psilocybe cyanescens]